MSKRAGIDIDTLRTGPRAPRTAKEVIEKKMRQELRAAGDSGASKKTGDEREEELAAYYRQRQLDKLEAARLLKQKQLLDNPGQSLLDCACGGEKRLEDLQYVLAQNPPLDILIPSGDLGESPSRTPLHAACQVGSQAGVEALVRAGAEVDFPNEDGITALMIAVNNGHLGIVTFLLDHSGAQPDRLDRFGHSALERAYERGHTAIAAKLVKALSLPPALITTVARERLADAAKKAEAAAKKEMEEKKALLAKTIKEVREEEKANQK